MDDIASAADEYVRDLVTRMEDDLVSYPEAHGVSLSHFEGMDNDGRLEQFVGAVLRLVREGRAVVGDLEVDPADGLVFVAPWSERGLALEDRLWREVSALPRPKLGEGFWLSRPH